jgi:hypothetical protein
LVDKEEENADVMMEAKLLKSGESKMSKQSEKLLPLLDLSSLEQLQQTIVNYGLELEEILELRIDLSRVDSMYCKWIEQDNSLGDMLNAKITKELNTKFRVK